MRAKNEETKLRIYEFINEYIKVNRVSPTIREIAESVNCAVSTAYKFLGRLQDEGLIDMAGRGRITSSVNNFEMDYAPILGLVACGKPQPAIEDIQGYLPINMQYFGSGEYFALVASGESMLKTAFKALKCAYNRISMFGRRLSLVSTFFALFGRFSLIYYITLQNSAFSRAVCITAKTISQGE